MALNQAASQYDSWVDFTGWMAVDGNPATIGHTATVNSWWQVTFKPVYISQLVIYGRRDTCCYDRFVNFDILV